MRTKAQEKRRARAFVAVAKKRRDNPACGKVAFPSRRVAEGRLRTLAAERMTKTYRCPDCGLWHLTSQVERGPTDVRIWRKPEGASDADV